VRQRCAAEYLNARGSSLVRVLVFGATGLLGPYLCDAAESLGSVVRCGRRRGEVLCDATNPSEVAALIAHNSPDVIVNCIALTDVDACENDSARADELNRQVVGTIVDSAPANTVVVQISTDQVYPGTAAPYDEARVEPINSYGRSKLAGEKDALRHPEALVLRVNFFGPSRMPDRKSLSDWMIESLVNGAPMTLFEDSLFSPLHLESVANLTVHAVKRGLRGVYNLGSRFGTSKAEFGLAIARHLSLDAGHARLGQSSETPGRARRPKDMRMDVTCIEAALGYAMPSMHDEIQRLKL
jgi:dTDP-4-dehydrorhamnose reductase